ncbi:peroxiredoxin [Marinobacter zhejiangensis]|uniref:thioredoxin-dependent peroxiredoxin n=1 Tax=Marinobacter zhejiangensis TaxID=488535 RepID=A0A1I4RL89_9GAMM|nr:peroxiredoxin [Marinobacter zhejiangensis]SFM52991.1 peroxiredoxin Q/BCP [Marinobacter zhejiangensis]
MSTVELNKPVADFEASATDDQTIRLSDFQGKKNVVIYFYPKDNTPGCTTEGQDFRDRHQAFEAADTVIFGVSRDSVRTHNNFRTKHEFPFHLISDPEEALCKQFDVIKLKKLYGKEYMGIDRSTFLIDKDGVLRQEWRTVKVKGHVDEVLESAQNL